MSTCLASSFIRMFKVGLSLGLVPSTHGHCSICPSDCLKPVDIVFVLDASRSCGKENFEKMVTYAQSIIEDLSIGQSSSNVRSRVGLMTFDGSSRLVFHLNRYSTKYDILNAFTPHYSAGSSSNIAEGIRYMRENMFTSSTGDRDHVPNVAVLLTDSRSPDETAAWTQSVKARDAGIHIITVAIGNNVNIDELLAISSEPSEVGKSLLRVSSFDQLPNYRDVLSDALCKSECSPGPYVLVCESKLMLTQSV